MTKIPTAIAIMQLREQGKLDLDEAVTQILPWFDVTYPSSTSPVVTVRHLLQHTSGLPDTITAMIGWVHYVVHFYTPLLPTLLDTNKLIRQRQGKLMWLNRVYIDATPSTGLIGTSTDVARFMLAYLNRGSLDGNLLLNPKSVSMLTETPPVDGHGLGWSVGETDNAH
jgi:CubicO group peptidase (beta-lactamase class C family)